MTRSFFLLLTVCGILASGALVSCGNDDDDDDGNARADMERIIGDAQSKMESNQKKMADHLCDCAQEMQPGYDCSEFYESDDDGDNFPKPEEITDCDVQVYEEFSGDLKRGVDCMVDLFGDLADTMTDMSCEDLFSDGGGFTEGFDDEFEACEDQIGNTDQWVIDHGIEDCVEVFKIDN